MEKNDLLSQVAARLAAAAPATPRRKPITSPSTTPLDASPLCPVLPCVFTPDVTSEGDDSSDEGRTPSLP